MTENLNMDITGNPFVDSGCYALKIKLGKKLSDISVDDLKGEFEFISDLYINPVWNKQMHTIFPNSKLVNPSVKGNRQELYLDILNKLADGIGSLKDNGSCMACGRRDANNLYYKQDVPLTGSGSLKNYFSYANSGADYCSLCALLIQFAPLVMYRCGGRMIVLQSNSQKIMEIWAKKAINNIELQKTSGDYTGCYNQGITRPTNAIFNIISQILSYERKWRGESPSFNFYYFTNYNQDPQLNIYTLPTGVFKFLAEIPRDDWGNWSFIVKKAYHVKWDKVKSEDDYKSNQNSVFDYLLEGKSILKFFYSFKSRKVYCTWKLVESYLIEVKNMDEKRINVIRDVGDRLSLYIEKNNSDKMLNKLELASNYNNFRNVLRKILKNKIDNGDKELLFTFDEYVNDLFPEGNKTWRETQDLLLFRIYDNLHTWLVENEFVEEKSEEELLGEV